ncbi:MAG: CYTH domain-containing protein [Lachnospiraceae bacterium]|nr:CYTH domain-containing protein [Lachnospiraceae bacterium]
MEIEHKYLIKKLPENLDLFKKKEIEQGYLNRSPVLRIRKSNDKYIFTYKAKKNAGSGNSPIVNEEIEAELTKEAYEHLKEKTDGNLIRKTRYIIPYSFADKEYRIELDVFHGRLEGLVFAEVEFESVEDAMSFMKPEWFGEEVTSDRRYRNGFLTEQENLDVFKDSDKLWKES